jgi:hypothetical protein
MILGDKRVGLGKSLKGRYFTDLDNNVHEPINFDKSFTAEETVLTKYDSSER